MRLLIISLMAFSLSLAAEEVEEYHEDASQYQEPVYQDPTGVQVRFNEDGSMRSIIAAGEADLMFGDRRDIRQALKKANMRAKAEIAKFLQESIRSQDTLNEMTKVASKLDTAGNEQTTREIVETQVEAIENSAEALLTGVVTLKQEIFKDEKYVLVVVGIKKETIDAATQLSDSINQSLSSRQPAPAAAAPVAPAASGAASQPAPPQNIRKSSMYDSF